MVSVCLPSDALSQHLPSYLGFSYLGRGLSLHGCSSKAQPLLLTLDKFTPPDLERGVAPLGPRAPLQPLLLGRSTCFTADQKPGKFKSTDWVLDTPIFQKWMHCCKARSAVENVFPFSALEAYAVSICFFL